VSPHIRVERDGQVARVVVDRPDKLNAFTAEMLLDMRGALVELGATPSVRVVVIEAAGDRAFSTGADLAEMRDMDGFTVRTSNRRWIDLFATIESIPQPVVASVAGHAIAGGTELTLCCDFVVASERASFGLTEMRVGVIPGAGACVRLTRWLGRAAAKRILMLGEPVDAAEAHRLGLVTQVVPHAELRRATDELAGVLASRSPLALAAAKRAVNIGSELDLDRGIEYVLQEFALLFDGPDQREGMSAFLEKRAPSYADPRWSV
jgi:enoyl-CoA hydratase/carnithine racemase